MIFEIILFLSVSFLLYFTVPPPWSWFLIGVIGVIVYMINSLLGDDEEDDDGDDGDDDGDGDGLPQCYTSLRNNRAQKDSLTSSCEEANEYSCTNDCSKCSGFNIDNGKYYYCKDKVGEENKCTNDKECRMIKENIGTNNKCIEGRREAMYSPVISQLREMQENPTTGVTVGEVAACSATAVLLPGGGVTCAIAAAATLANAYGQSEQIAHGGESSPLAYQAIIGGCDQINELFANTAVCSELYGLDTDEGGPKAWYTCKDFDGGEDTSQVCENDTICEYP